jgi:hypothetical protein
MAFFEFFVAFTAIKVHLGLTGGCSPAGKGIRGAGTYGLWTLFCVIGDIGDR